MKHFQNALFVLLAFIAVPTPAFAHVINGSGFHSGLLHPLTGIDHLLAMVAVGVISSQLSKRSVWKPPAAFITSMITGGLLGITGVPVVGIEIGIALSVLIFGMCIAFPQRFSWKFTMLAIAFAGMCHGYAHGAEIPIVTNPFAYVAGFVLSTTLIHVFGITLARAASLYERSSNFLRTSGGVMLGCAGLFFLFS